MSNSIELYDGQGQRKYVTPEERSNFLAHAATLPDRAKRMLCLTLAHTGSRVSECIQLTPRRIDLASGHIVIRTLKRNKKRTHYRAVPVPPSHLDALDLVFGLRAKAMQPDDLLWPITRNTAYRIVKGTMHGAGIDITAPHGMPKALRHGFATNALLKGVPLTEVRRYLGHASLETTAIYLDLVGGEARELAERMWAS